MQIGFELAKIFVAASIPALVAYFGWRINQRLKSIDQAQWQNRKIIELRIDLYREISPRINSMYCFCKWVGDWKTITPKEMIELKRHTDKTVNVYRHLFSDGFYKSYNDFIHTIFPNLQWSGRRCQDSIPDSR